MKQETEMKNKPEDGVYIRVNDVVQGVNPRGHGGRRIPLGFL